MSIYLTDQLVWHGASTTVGPVRARNEDALYAGSRIFVVADGIGGRPGGQAAAQVAVRTVINATADRLASPENLRSAVQLAHRAVRRDGVDDGRGCTLTVLGITPGFATIAHVGDSRCSMIRGEHLLHRTTDHTMLTDHPGVSKRSPAGRAMAGTLTRYIGQAITDVEIDEHCWPFAVRDRLVLTSDGVHDQLSTKALIETATGGSCEQAAIAMVSAALHSGTSDNATAIVVEIA